MCCLSHRLGNDEKTVFLFLATSIFSIGCGRTILKDEKEVFVGEWKLQSIGMAKVSGDEFVDASDLPDTYEIRIERKGYMHWYKNGEVVNTVQLKEEYFKCHDGEDEIAGYTYKICYLRVKGFSDQLQYFKAEGSVAKFHFTYFPIEPGGEIMTCVNTFVKE